MAATFDNYSKNYNHTLWNSLKVTGEGAEYYVKHRLLWSQKILNEINLQPKSVLDFGCGVGQGCGKIQSIFSPTKVLGIDISKKSLEMAKKVYGSKTIQFQTVEEYQPKEEFDVVYTNGVFHHIPIEEREKWLKVILKSLRPGGVFLFWENNPWNIGTRYIMRKVEFDRDAVLINVLEAKRILKTNGFSICDRNFLFYFPRGWRMLLPLEKYLVRLPLGGQYVVLSKKPL